MKKYLLYAIGEILLVVIGILIAVSINNWNEGRKLKVTQLDLAKKVKEQMVLDTINFGKVIRYSERIKRRFDLALRETAPDEPLDCLGCLSLVSGNMNIANMDPKVIHLFREAQLSEDSLSKALRKIQVAYEDSSSILNLLEESMVNNLKTNMEYLQKFKWFAPVIANGQCGTECLDYVQNSFDLRNRLAYTELLTITAYGSQVIEFYDEIGAFIEELEAALDTN